MANITDKELKPISYLTADSVVYVADDSKAGGAGNEKDVRLTLQSLLGGTPGFVRYNDASGIYNTGEAQLFYNPTTKRFSIGLIGSPVPQDVLHLNSSSGTFGIRFTTTAKDVTLGAKIQSDGDSLINDYRTNLLLRYLGTNIGRFDDAGLVLGNSTRKSGSVFDASSITDKGILIPRLTTAQRDAITVGSTQNSLLIFNTDNDRYEYYEHSSTSWKPVGAVTQSLNWQDSGNAFVTLSYSANQNDYTNITTNNTAIGNAITYDNSGKYWTVSETGIYNVQAMFYIRDNDNTYTGDVNVEISCKNSTAASPTIFVNTIAQILHEIEYLDFHTVVLSATVYLEATSRIKFQARNSTNVAGSSIEVLTERISISNIS